MIPILMPDTLLAVAVIYISPHAVGSGIPEMRTILSGISSSSFSRYYYDLIRSSECVRGDVDVAELRLNWSGIEIRHYLSFRTFIAKVIGFASAWVVGFSIGREGVLFFLLLHLLCIPLGPYVHMCVMVCRQLIRIPIFRHIYEVRFLFFLPTSLVDLSRNYNHRPCARPSF